MENNISIPSDLPPLSGGWLKTLNAGNSNKIQLSTTSITFCNDLNGYLTLTMVATLVNPFHLGGLLERAIYFESVENGQVENMCGTARPFFFRFSQTAFPGRKFKKKR